jgi:hypothetical protein
MPGGHALLMPLEPSDASAALDLQTNCLHKTSKYGYVPGAPAACSQDGGWLLDWLLLFC